MIIGQDTDSESNLLEAAMPWLVKNDKEFDWVGKWATQQVDDRGLNWMLVGFESPTGAMPVEGGQVVVDGKSSGRVTSVRKSDELGKVIGLAILPTDLAVDGGRFDVQVNGKATPMTRAARRVLRPGGREGQVVSALDFLSVGGGWRRRGCRLGDCARAARPRRAVRGARRLAGPGLAPRREGASRGSRCRRSLAPDEARVASRRRADRGRGRSSGTRSRRAARSSCAQPRAPQRVREQVGDRFVLDVTGAYSIIALAGPEAATVLRRMTHMHHFPAGGEIAHVQGHVLERG